jgi:PAS domain S-box-containing protein
MALRMGAWFVFRAHWSKADRLRQARASRRLTALTASCQELLWEIVDDRFVFLTPIVIDYLGYQPEELLGKPASIVFAEMEKERAEALRRTCSRTGCGWRNEEFTFRAKNGELRDFLTSGLAQTDAEGNVVSIAGSLRGLDGLPERQHTDRLRDQIRKVINKQSITTVFQPVIDATSGLVIGAEALTRFPSTQPPRTTEMWFTAAARAGLGLELEVAAIRQAFLIANETLPTDLLLAVNVSPATLLTGVVDDLIQQCGRSPASIVLEITEHVGIENYAELATRTHALRRQGLRLAVDDAGAGYASFQHILALRPDYIKLDRTLIAGIDTDPGKRALVKAVISFAGDIGATVIGEGIETEQELRAATHLGVQSMQGFYIGQPTPVAAWPKTLLSAPAINMPAPITLWRRDQPTHSADTGDQ